VDKIQTTVILAIIKTAYPTFGKDVSPEDIVSLWSEMFATDPVELVAAAVKRYIKSGEYPPTVAAISAILADMQAANLPTPAALWTEVDRLMNSGIAPDQEREAYGKMSPGCRAVTMAAGGWTALSLSAEDDQFIKRQFFRDAADYIAAEKQRLVLGGLAGPVSEVKSLPGDGKQVGLNG